MTEIRRGRAIGPGRVAACIAFLGWLLVLVPGLWGASPAAAQTATRDIRVGLYITSLNAIDPRDGSFGISGYAWFIDPTGAFDPSGDFELIARSASHEVFAHKELPDGGTYTAIAFSAVVDHAFDVRDYPFDRQTLVLHLEAADQTESLIFVPDRADSRIAESVRSPGWLIGDLRLVSSTKSYATGFGYRPAGASFSRLTAEIEISRKLSPLLFEKFTGFFVAFLITALVLLVPVDELGTRIGMTTGSIFAAVFNRYRLEDAIGFDAAFGIVDQVSVLTFSAILSMLLLSLVTHRLRNARGADAARSMNRTVGLAIVAVHALLIALAFATAMR